MATTQLCGPLDFEKTMSSQSGQRLGAYVAGELTYGGAKLVATGAATNVDTCNNQCTSNTGCQYTTFNTVSSVCNLYSFVATAGTLISFRTNPLPKNYNPVTLGRFEYVGNSGVVCIMMNILPNCKVLRTARPEYDRGYPGSLSTDPVRLATAPYGEISAIFDPIVGTHYPSIVLDILFCHGTILMSNGFLFTAGGDDNANYGAAKGFGSGLHSQKTFDYTTNTWAYGITMWEPR